MKKNIYFCCMVLVSIFLNSFLLDNSDPPIPTTTKELGEKLFFDPILSKDFTISCSSCHKPEFAFADNTAFSVGIGGVPTGRNTPTAMYLKDTKTFFWDGRAGSLEEQAMGPITHPAEMGLPLAEAVQRLKEDEFYYEAFLTVYNEEPDSALLLNAIADFERSLATYDSPYDKFLAGDDDAISESAKRGALLFLREQTCNTDACHAGALTGADSLVNIGVYDDKDMGLYNITKDPKDIGKFKSVHLRNIALTAPYMHDGSKKTLRDVIVFYNEPSNFMDGNIHPQARNFTGKLSEQDIEDSIAFLEALTDQRYLHLLDDLKEYHRTETPKEEETLKERK
ncbi:MAG: cytochrome c peroxidase [Bacteroidota bacterium]